MADKTQDCSTDQVSPELTSRELLDELLKAELRQLRIRMKGRDRQSGQQNHHRPNRVEKGRSSRVARG
jgi:hypothetical protein